MSECTFCGTAWNGRGKFCGTCGTTMAALESVTDAAPVSAPEEPGRPAAEETWVGELGSELSEDDPVALSTKLGSAAATPGAWWADPPELPAGYGERADPAGYSGYGGPGYGGAGYPGAGPSDAGYGGSGYGGAGYPGAGPSDAGYGGAGPSDAGLAAAAPAPAGPMSGGGYAPTVGAAGWGPPPGYVAGPLEPASFGARFAAKLIDNVLCAALGFVLFVVGIWVFAAVISDEPAVSDYYDNTSSVDNAILWGGVIAFAAAWLLPRFLLRLFGDGGAAGATPGRLALGIRLVRADGLGERVGYGRNLGRMIAHALDLLFYLSSLSMLWNDQRRTWHDRLSGTAVVRTRAGTPARSRPGPAWAALGTAVVVTALVVCVSPVVAVQFDDDRSDRVLPRFDDPDRDAPTTPAGSVLRENASDVTAAIAMSPDDAKSELKNLADRGKATFDGLTERTWIIQLGSKCPGSRSEDLHDSAGVYGQWDGADETYSPLGYPNILAFHRALVNRFDNEDLLLVRRDDVTATGVSEGCDGTESYLTLLYSRSFSGEEKALEWCDNSGIPEGQHCLARIVSHAGDSVSVARCIDRYKETGEDLNACRRAQAREAAGTS